MLHTWSFGDETHRGKGGEGTCNKKKCYVLEAMDTKNKEERGQRVEDVTKQNNIAHLELWTPKT
jgi:hypothetical protein